jgi:hypothetical protein
MKRLFRFRYPKLVLLIVFSILAYYIFSNDAVQEFVYGLNRLSYLGIFIAGVFFSFGFSTPFSTGFFLIASPDNIFIAAIIGGFGAMLADLSIFKLIKISFMDEFRRLEKTKLLREFNGVFHQKFLVHVKLYILYACAGIIIASPLPDEIGVSMLAGLTRIKASVLSVISFVMNTLGILLLLWIGS